MSFDPQIEQDKADFAAAQIPAPRLDPPFPWVPIAFDPQALNVFADPPLPRESQTSGD
jgi:hypothetical protein